MSSKAEEEPEEEEEEEEASLSELLSALALGVRAVHSLPVQQDFDYAASFVDYRAALNDSKASLEDVLSMVIPVDGNNPQLWEQVADLCDSLLDQAESHLQNTQQTNVVENLQQWSNKARQQATSSYSIMMEGMQDMDKPQITYHIPVDNDPTSPFCPKVHPAKPHAMVDLDLQLRKGQACDARFGGSADELMPDQPDVIGPAHYVPHVYRHEIQALEYQEWMTTASSSKQPAKMQVDEKLDATWIDTPAQLKELSKKLQTVNIMAIDLEAHSYRSFAGITCLMQITVLEDNDNANKKKQNYLIDTLKCWAHMTTYLASALANPKIVKVMHGADSDILWLQRDFGLYIVNLFDTGRAARCLKLPSFGFAYLLEKHVGIQADKKHQLSDWRQRPLPDEMRQYAIMDTHYLIDIYQQLKWDLEHHSNPTDVSIQKVLEASNLVCLVRYEKDAFRPMGYKSILNNNSNKRNTSKSRKKSKTDLTVKQQHVLKELYAWRDETARQCDESLQYVMGSNSTLLRLALACPTTVTALQSLLNPMPPLIIKFAQDVLERIQKGIAAASSEADDGENAEIQQASANSAFFKPADPNGEEREILSPVLGTEALYKQAGWMTPGVQGEHEHAVVPSTSEEEEGDQQQIKVDTSNQEYRSKGFTSHSLEMGTAAAAARGRTADGLGAVRSSSKERKAAADPKQDANRAQDSAVRIRTNMQQKDMLGLISPTNTELGDDEDDDENEPQGDKKKDDTDGGGSSSNDDFEIPKTMREIYQISNKNRRNKKVPSPVNVGGIAVFQDKMDVDTLEGAEKVLEGYFENDNVGANTNKGSKDNKRQRKEDVAFMQEIGWIKDKAEAEAMKKEAGGGDSSQHNVEYEQAGSPRTPRSPSEGGDKVAAAQAFDYSNVANMGVYNPSGPTSANPFFAGAAVSGVVPQQGGSSRRASEKKGRGSGRGGGKSGRGGSQRERPQKQDGRTHVYKKR